MVTIRCLTHRELNPAEAEAGMVGEPTPFRREEGHGDRASSGIWALFLLPAQRGWHGWTER